MEVCWKHWLCLEQNLIFMELTGGSTLWGLLETLIMLGTDMMMFTTCTSDNRWITFHKNSSVVYEWSLGRPNAMIFLSVQFFFRLWRHSERYREQPYDRRWNHDRVILVFDITRTTACIRIFDQMDTSDSIRFMSKASYTASGSTEFKDFIIHFFLWSFEKIS